MTHLSGVHWPLDSGEARALAARGEEPTVLHNNCSGKHCGFLAVGAVRGLMWLVTQTQVTQSCVR